MNKPDFDVNKLRVASPCHISWETMIGDGRARHCQSCKLNVYNISEMTEAEVKDLVLKREDRICIRLYKRADGTVLTKDCPVGFRAYQKRVTRFAGAALAAILGLFSVSFAQKQDEKITDASKLKVTKTLASKSDLTGVVLDVNGAVIPNAEINLYKYAEKKPLKIKSNSDGEYSFKSLSEGVYMIAVKFPAFKKQIIENIKIKDGESVKLNITLEPKGKYVTVGLYAEEPLVDTTSSGVTTKITREMLDRIPH